jgi:hypothetical protein
MIHKTRNILFTGLTLVALLLTVILAALSLRPEAGRSKQESVPVRFSRAEDSTGGIHLHRRPLSHAATKRSGSREVPTRTS